MKKGVSALVATILMLIITVALAGMAYMFVMSFFPPKDVKAERYCEGWCVSEQLEYDRYDGYSKSCYCEKCKTKELLEKNVTSCETIVFHLVVVG